MSHDISKREDNIPLDDKISVLFLTVECLACAPSMVRSGLETFEESRETSLFLLEVSMIAEMMNIEKVEI